MKVTDRFKIAGLIAGVTALLIGATGLVAQAAAPAAATLSGFSCQKTDKANGGFTLDCDPAVAPSPSPSTTSPSPSPTTAPATTPPVTTPPVSPSPSPTTTGPTQSNNCMVNPHLCGFPDTTNTGVKPGSTLTTVAGFTAKSNVTYQNLNINGCVSIPVGVNNVIIRNSRINCSGTLPIDAEDHPHTGLLFEDVEINMGGNFFGRGIAGGGFTARRVWWHNGSDCSHFNSSVVIEDSFCDVSLYTGSQDPHLDGFQSGGGSGVVLRHNTIRNPNFQTSAIINGPATPPLDPQFNVRIVNNLMTGGGYTVYCNAHQAATVPTIEFSGNRIAMNYYKGGDFHGVSGQYGPTTDCTDVPASMRTGNVIDETGAPLPIA